LTLSVHSNRVGVLEAVTLRPASHILALASNAKTFVFVCDVKFPLISY